MRRQIWASFASSSPDTPDSPVAASSSVLSSAASAARDGFPVAPLGMELKEMIRRGSLNSASREAMKRRRPISGTGAPGRNTTTAIASSPRVGCGTPKAAASKTDGCAIKESSISPGRIFSPPRLIISLIRPVTNRNPSASSRPRSPVLSHPSRNALWLASGLLR